MGIIFALLGILVVAIIIFVVIKSVARGARSKCSKCHTPFVYGRDIIPNIGDLEWEEKTKEEKKGDYTYEITYRVYYRWVRFTCICPSCKNVKIFSKRFDLYRNDCGHSQSHEQQMALLKSKIEALFDESVFQE